MKNEPVSCFVGRFFFFFGLFVLHFFPLLTAELPWWARETVQVFDWSFIKRCHGGSGAAFAGTCARVNMYFLCI